MSSFVNTFLEVQQTLRPKVFESYLLEPVLTSHPLPHNFFEINDENVILVSKNPTLPEKCEDIPVMLLSTSCDEGGVDTSGHDLGSPLELYDYQKDLQLNSSYGEISMSPNSMKKVLCPLSQNEAGCILGLYNIGFQKHLEKKPWRIWVASDGSQREGFVFRSSLVLHPDSGQTVVNSLYVTYKGHSFNLNHVDFIQSMLPPRYFNAECNMDFSSSYCLYGADKDTSTSKVMVTFTWEEESAILCPPPVDANAVLSIEVDEEENFGPSSGFYQELCTIEKLVDGITDEVVRWPVSSNFPRPPEKVALLISRVQGIFMEGTKTSQVTKQMEKSKKSIFNVSPCHETDFTDDIWNILKDCSSYQELINCFKCVFEALQSKKLQPLLGSNNQTSLANLIRSSYSTDVKKEADAWLKDDKPLIMLAEIGIEKLKKDYMFNFMTSGIVTATQLAYYLGNMDSDGLAEKLYKLRRLHRILELCLVLDQNIIMQRSSLMEVLSFSLKYYQSNDSKNDLRKPFEMPISVLSIIEPVKKTSPSVWRCRVSGCPEGGKEVQGCIYLSKNPIFHHVNQNILQGIPLLKKILSSLVLDI